MSYFSNGDGELRDAFEQGFWLKGTERATAILRERVGAHATHDVQHQALRTAWVETLHDILAHRGWCHCVRDTDPCWRRAHPDAQDHGTFGTEISFGSFAAAVLDRIVAIANVTGTPVPADEATPQVRPVGPDGHFE